MPNCQVFIKYLECSDSDQLLRNLSALFLGAAPFRFSVIWQHHVQFVGQALLCDIAQEHAQVCVIASGVSNIIMSYRSRCLTGMAQVLLQALVRSSAIHHSSRSTKFQWDRRRGRRRALAAALEGDYSSYLRHISFVGSACFVKQRNLAVAPRFV